MPPPVLLGPAAYAAIAASKGAILGTADAALAYVLARLVWNHLPEWVRDDISVRNMLKSSDDKRRGSGSSSSATNDISELATLASVIEKLQGLLISGSEKLASGTLSEKGEPIPHFHVSLICYIHLASQFRRLYPKNRNLWHSACGEPISELDHGRFRGSKDNNLNSTKLMQCFDFAVYSYEVECESLQEKLGNDFSVIQHNTLLTKPIRPGYVGHYLAVSESQKLVVVAIRGTSSLEDWLTDCCGRAVSYDDDHIENEQFHSPRIEVRAAEPHMVLHSAFHEEGDDVEIVSGLERISVEHDHEHSPQNKVRCHEGILITAKRLANEIQDCIKEFVLSRGFRVLLCGHSLGAGVATLLSIVLRERFTQLAHGPKSDLMNVIVFAPPPVLDHDTAISCSSYTLSVVNNSDMIPKSSLANLAVLLELLRAISVRLKQQNLIPKNPVSTVTLIKKLTKSMDLINEEDLLMSVDEVKQEIQSAHERVELRDPDHLYVPGRVLFMSEEWYVDGRDEEKDENEPCQDRNVQFILTDGTTSVLRLLEIDAFRMVTDHVTASYETSLRIFDCMQRNA
jgi:Lipase (class 3)